MILPLSRALALAALLCSPVAADELPLALERIPAPNDSDTPRAQLIAAFVLSSSDDRFGGVSGVSLAGDRLVMAIDRGRWAALDIERGANGVLANVRSAEIGALLDAGGVELSGPDVDAEGIAFAAGRFWVSFEGAHRVTSYLSLGDDAGPDAPDAPSALLENNGGLEGLATAPDGALIAIAEEAAADDPKGDIAGWRFIGDQSSRFTIPRLNGFSPTGAEVTPDGALYLLERRFTWIGGIWSRIRYFPNPNFATGEIGEGETLITLGPNAPIDNMEAIAVEPRPDGGALITLISDDNFSWRQRTIILQVAVAP